MQANIAVRRSLSLVLLAACSGSTVDPPAGPDAGEASMPPDAPISDPHENPDAGSTTPPGCTWHADKLTTTTFVPNSWDFTISQTGERALAFTSLVNGNNDVIVAKATKTGSFTTFRYSLDLLESSNDVISARYGANGKLHVAYSNRAKTYDGGGTYYASGPGSSLLIDDGGLFYDTKGPAIAVAYDNSIHIAYSVSGPFEHRVAVASSSNGTQFSITPAIAAPSLDGNAQIDVDALNRLHVAGADSTNALYAIRTGTTWSSPSIMGPRGAASGSKLLVTTSGYVYSTRQNSTAIIRTRGWHDAWTQSSDMNNATRAFAYTDAGGARHVVTAGANGSLVYQRAYEQPVTIVASGPAVYNVAIAFDLQTGPQIAYDAGTPTAHSLYVAKCD